MSTYRAQYRRLPCLLDEPGYLALNDKERGFVTGLLLSRTTYLPGVYVGSMRSFAAALDRPFSTVQRIAVALKQKGIVDYDETERIIVVAAPFGVIPSDNLKVLAGWILKAESDVKLPGRVLGQHLARLGTLIRAKNPEFLAAYEKLVYDSFHDTVCHTVYHTVSHTVSIYSDSDPDPEADSSSCRDPNLSRGDKAPTPEKKNEPHSGQAQPEADPDQKDPTHTDAESQPWRCPEQSPKGKDLGTWSVPADWTPDARSQAMAESLGLDLDEQVKAYREHNDENPPDKTPRSCDRWFQGFLSRAKDHTDRRNLHVQPSAGTNWLATAINLDDEDEVRGAA